MTEGGVYEGSGGCRVLSGRLEMTESKNTDVANDHRDLEAELTEDEAGQTLPL